jgi:hypothetical protein
VLAALAAASVWAARADDGCGSCGDEITFPEAADFLKSQGYPPDEYKVLLTWNEACPKAPRALVAGYHVLPLDGSKPFDLYSDSAGLLLDGKRLAELGIRFKNWDLRPKEAPAEAALAGAKSVAARPAPVGVKNGVRPEKVVELPAIDIAKVMQEDQAANATPEKGVARIGVFRDLPTPLEIAPAKAGPGAWTALPDGGRLWAATIRSPGALGQRVHFPVLRLPRGGQVVVYNAGDPSESYGPYQGFYPGDRDFWSPTCFGESVVVECSVAAGIDAGNVALKADRITHIYRSFETLQWMQAGWCNLDVTCYPEWQTSSLGVGGIGTIGVAGSLWCTGSLLVDTDPATRIPYFLTANHCVRGQDGSRGASYIEVYWLYQTDTCNGTPPVPTWVPRTTGGADYLGGSGGNAHVGTGNDFTLLRLRQAPPPEVSYLGWSLLGPALGSEVTCIHHPWGDFKRIAFGNLTERDNPFPDLYHEVTWHDGTTEPASSGSPLMLRATQQVIGQLWGGDASCDYLDGPDHFGRFNVTFPVVRSYLDPPGNVPQVGFSTPNYLVAEADTVIDITVVCDIPPGGPVSVDYSVGTGARRFRDYEPTTGTLVFEGTIQVRTFSVAIHDDTHTERDPTVALTLSNPVGCVLAGGGSSAVLTIVDNDPDSDGDGLSDYDEVHGVFGYVTDPNNPDMDDDGISDYDEEMGTFGFRTDPTTPTQLSALSVPFFSPRLRP